MSNNWKAGFEDHRRKWASALNEDSSFNLARQVAHLDDLCLAILWANSSDCPRCPESRVSLQ